MECTCSGNKPKECGRNICCGRCEERDNCEHIDKCKECADTTKKD